MSSLPDVFSLAIKVTEISLGNIIQLHNHFKRPFGPVADCGICMFKQLKVFSVK